MGWGGAPMCGVYEHMVYMHVCGVGSMWGAVSGLCVWSMCVV